MTMVHLGKQDKWKIFFNEDKQNDEEEKKFEDNFEAKAEEAFLKIRQNAEIFINMLILMIVSGIPELNMKSIGTVRKALFLDVSDEEASIAR